MRQKQDMPVEAQGVNTGLSKTESEKKAINYKVIIFPLAALAVIGLILGIVL